jgi:hypothetical protein
MRRLSRPRDSPHESEAGVGGHREAAAAQGKTTSTATAFGGPGGDLSLERGLGIGDERCVPAIGSYW